jgi:hypothetical protein
MNDMTLVYIVLLDGFIFNGFDLVLLVLLLRVADPARNGHYRHKNVSGIPHTLDQSSN